MGEKKKRKREKKNLGETKCMMEKQTSPVKITCKVENDRE